MSWIFTPTNIDRNIFLLTVILGIALSCVYGFRCRRGFLKFRESTLILIFLRCGGIVTGVLLMVTTVDAVVKSISAPLPLPTFIGGALVSVVSSRGLYEEIFKSQPQ